MQHVTPVYLTTLLIIVTFAVQLNSWENHPQRLSGQELWSQVPCVNWVRLYDGRGSAFPLLVDFHRIPLTPSWEQNATSTKYHPTGIGIVVES